MRTFRKSLSGSFLADLEVIVSSHNLYDYRFSSPPLLIEEIHRPCDFPLRFYFHQASFTASIFALIINDYFFSPFDLFSFSIASSTHLSSLFYSHAVLPLLAPLLLLFLHLLGDFAPIRHHA